MSIASLVINDVFNDVLAEIEYQNTKWGEQHIRQQTVEGHLLVLQAEVQEAINGWMKNSTGRDSVESEITQVAAVAIQALINIKCSELILKPSEVAGQKSSKAGEA